MHGLISSAEADRCLLDRAAAERGVRAQIDHGFTQYRDPRCAGALLLDPERVRAAAEPPLDAMARLATC